MESERLLPVNANQYTENYKEDSGETTSNDVWYIV